MSSSFLEEIPVFCIKLMFAEDFYLLRVHVSQALCESCGKFCVDF